MSNFGASVSVLAAGYVSDYRFSSIESYRAYVSKLFDKPYEFCILESRLCSDGSVLARIVRQHNGRPLIELPLSEMEV